LYLFVYHIGKYKAGNPFNVEMIHHGYLIGLERDGASRLVAEWEVMVAAFTHYVVTEKGGSIDQLSMHPVFISTSIVGLVARHEVLTLSYNTTCNNIQHSCNNIQHATTPHQYATT